MSDFTEPEMKLMASLLAQFQVDVLRQAKHPELTEAGREQYVADATLARVAQAKLDTLRLLA